MPTAESCSRLASRRSLVSTSQPSTSSTDEPTDEVPARRVGGWDELYTTVPKGVVVDPTEVVDVLRRFIRQIVDEALTARGIR